MISYFETLYTWYPETLKRSIIISFVYLLVIFVFNELYRVVKKREYTIFYFLFFSYITCIFFLTLATRTKSESFRFILLPMHSYISFFRGDYSSGEDIIENVFLYIPWFFLTCNIVDKSKNKYVPLLGIYCSLLFEIAQLITKCGYFEIDDVINNSLGVFIGYYLTSLIRRQKHENCYYGGR